MTGGKTARKRGTSFTNSCCWLPWLFIAEADMVTIINMEKEARKYMRER
jgi:hypothetical protein